MSVSLRELMLRMMSDTIQLTDVEVDFSFHRHPSKWIQSMSHVDNARAATAEANDTSLLLPFLFEDAILIRYIRCI